MDPAGNSVSKQFLSQACFLLKANRFPLQTPWAQYQSNQSQQPDLGCWVFIPWRGILLLVREESAAKTPVVASWKSDKMSKATTNAHTNTFRVSSQHPQTLGSILELQTRFLKMFIACPQWRKGSGEDVGIERNNEIKYIHWAKCLNVGRGDLGECSTSLMSLLSTDFTNLCINQQPMISWQRKSIITLPKTIQN